MPGVPQRAAGSEACAATWAPPPGRNAPPQSFTEAKEVARARASSTLPTSGPVPCRNEEHKGRRGGQLQGLYKCGGSVKLVSLRWCTISTASRASRLLRQGGQGE